MLSPLRTIAPYSVDLSACIPLPVEYTSTHGQEALWVHTHRYKHHESVAATSAMSLLRLFRDHAVFVTDHPLTCIFAFLFAVLIQKFLTSSRHRYPPGPKPLPIVGNILQVPMEDQEKTFASWGQEYGDVVYVTVLQKSIVILNSFEAAHDLLEKRSSIYSDRPRLVLIAELMGWDSVVTNLRYGPRFRKHRRLIQDGFNPKAILAFRPIIEEEVAVLLDELMKTPGLFMRHIRRYAAGSILNVTYGHKARSIDDIYIHMAEQAATATLESGSPGSMLVDFFPALKYLPTWLPGTAFKRNALKVRQYTATLLNEPFEMVKRNMSLGIGVRSFASDLMEKHSADADETIDEEDLKGVVGVMYAGALDTTSSVMTSFFLAMTLYPDVYRRAQLEMDRVVGLDRLPNLQDRESLPYLDGVFKEIFRWNPALPLGLPHSMIEDDSYRNYYLPKGAIVIPNIWAMARDPAIYADPHVFSPERFLSGQSPDPREFVFGFGRRACAGRHFGEASIWLAIANVTAIFSITKDMDGSGRQITPLAEFTGGFVSTPKSFACRIRPRSQKAVELVESIRVDPGT